MESDETVILKRTTVDLHAADGRPPPPTPVEIPRRLGSVRLIRQIGQGGMGVVWLGRDELLNRDVAVKFLLNLVADEDDPGFASLLEGARAAAALRHEGLNAVLHADVVDRVPFLVMEYVDGPTVSQVLQRFGKLSLAVVRLLLAASCEAVGELHDQNVIHRDIKPSNILLTREGKPVLTDFGLACWRSSTAIGTSVKGVAGTPAYMAPEMFDKIVSPRSDVYALGVMAFEMVVGEVPFDGSLQDIERAHRECPLPQDALAEMHPELAQFIERAMHKNPMFRYKSARHMLRAVEEVFGAMDEATVGMGKGRLELGSLISRALFSDGDGTLTESGRDLHGTYYERLGTLVNSRKKATSEADDSGHELLKSVETDLACVRCGTSLKGEPVTGRCPNCLLLIKLTLEPSSAMGSGSGWALPQSKPSVPVQEPESRNVLDSASQPPTVPAPPENSGWKSTFKRFLNDLLGR